MLNRRLLVTAILSLGLGSASIFADEVIIPGVGSPGAFFAVRVVDEATGRGVPLVELTTTHNITFVTDSAGLAAVHLPGLMGQRTWFTVKSHGYEFKPDGFGLRGFAATLEPGGQTTVQITRKNIAQRMYRVTGQGLYHDSVLLGEATPIQRPVINSNVMGQDSICTAIYRDKLYWFWGDTSLPGYPLGHFGTAGATSKLPQEIDPAVGVDLNYFENSDGSSRGTYDTSRPGPMWMGSLFKVREGDRERLVSYYMRVKDVGNIVEHGIALWNDQTQMFDRKSEWPLDVPVTPQRQSLAVREDDGSEWLYFCSPFPTVRVRATLQDVLNPAAYQGYTCIRSGGKGDRDIERDSAGQPLWRWRSDAPLFRTALTYYQNSEKPGESTAATDLHLLDVETQKPVYLQSGSVHYNAYRKKWVLLGNQYHGTSVLGEVWYAQADSLQGPWSYARKVVTHDDYSFYNVMHHPYFDREGGRLIYFEGTYTTLFAANNPRPTPRYDYNQIMYQLDLADPGLDLPVPPTPAP